MRISDWSSDVCSYDLIDAAPGDILGCAVEAVGLLRRKGRARRLGIRRPIEDPVQHRRLGHAWMDRIGAHTLRSEEHTSELQSLMRISYAVFCLKKKTTNNTKANNKQNHYHITRQQITLQTT